MKNQQRPRTEPEARPSAEAEQREWEALIATAKQRQDQRTDTEAADWAAAIERAKALPRVTSTNTIDQREWEERIARARQRPTPAASEVAREGTRPSLRDRLERLAARAAELAGAQGSAPRGPAAPTEEEEAQWRAAIHKAKTGHA